MSKPLPDQLQFEPWNVGRSFGGQIGLLFPHPEIEGRLDGAGICIDLLDEDRETDDEGNTTYPRADERARRVVAAWNAFEGIRTEAIEAEGSLANLLQEILDCLIDKVAGSCEWCDGEGSWTNTKPAKMLPVVHTASCPIPRIEALLSPMKGDK